MDGTLKDPILKFYENTVEEVRKSFGLDKSGAMNDAVNILDEWVKTQNHFLKKDFKREYLERMIISTKGSVERAKAQLDKLCTLRTLTPQFFGSYDVKEYFKVYYDNNLAHAYLPRLTDDHYRIYVIKNVGKDYTLKHFTDYYRLHIMLAEYLRAHDYVNGYIYVIDYTELSIMDFATKMNLVELRQMLTVLMEGYGVRIKGIHIITPSKLVDIIISAFKQVLSAKIGSRIQVHKDIESLHECIDKELLPKDYGGKEKTLKELHDDWVNVLGMKKNVEYQQEMNAARTDESRRQRDTFNDQYMGMAGTFRTLSVD